MVVLFCGRVLPLDSDIIKNKTTEEKKNHLMSVLGKFLEERVSFLFDRHIGETEEDVLAQAAEHQAHGEDGQHAEPQFAQRHVSLPSTQISSGELEKFVQIDLPLLDNPEYFKTIFG